MGKDRDINMTVAYITPPVPALFVHTSNQERQIQLAFPLHSGKVRVREGVARDGGEEMARAVVNDNVQYLQKIEHMCPD